MSTMFKKRNPNFTYQEIQVLIDEVDRNKDILLSKYSSITSSAKTKTWESICNRFNASAESGNFRTVAELRKKWVCLMSDSKRKLATAKRDSDGRVVNTSSSTPNITNIDERIGNIIGNAQPETFLGGLDFGDSRSEHEDSVGLQMISSASNFQESSFSIKIEDSDIVEFSSASPTPENRTPAHENQKKNNCEHHVAPVDLEKKRHQLDIEQLEIKRQKLDIEEQKLEIEEQKLKIEKQKVELKRQSIDVERQRLDIELERLAFEQEKQRFYKSQLIYPERAPSEQEDSSTNNG